MTNGAVILITGCLSVRSVEYCNGIAGRYTDYVCSLIFSLSLATQLFIGCLNRQPSTLLSPASFPQNMHVRLPASSSRRPGFSTHR
ncbi:hypothetical protein C8R43DRAFT_982021 [Mycena crocata]|nr:hypothetical protein C8R43DRAFT_982021 [Mycena crocata]